VLFNKVFGITRHVQKELAKREQMYVSTHRTYGKVRLTQNNRLNATKCLHISQYLLTVVKVELLHIYS